MSWMAKLHETYEQGMNLDIGDELKPMPISHTLQSAYINIVIDGTGNFIKAKALEKIKVILPATEGSAGRAGKIPPPHPLADKLQYVAADYRKHGGLKPSFYKNYKELLESWCASKYSHPKAKAVLSYVTKETVIRDLVNSEVCFLDNNGALLTSWPYEDTESHPLPLLFKVLPKEKRLFKQGNALVCWTVEIVGDSESETWLDKSLQQSWIDFDAQSSRGESLCYVSGHYTQVAVNHPAKLRHTGDKAKLLSANDKSGFTFRGKFVKSHDVASVSYESTQKAHNALRWLISRQGYRNGDQVVVAWAVSGKPIPEPIADTLSFDIEDVSDHYEPDGGQECHSDYGRDMGQRFAISLKKAISGYRVKLEANDSIIVMSLDSATPGRMAVTYYRDFSPNDYLQVVEKWHSEFAWPQRISMPIESTGKKSKTVVRWFVCAPSPRNIIEAAYGDIVKSNATLKKSLIERLLPCIVEGRTVPLDVVNLAVTRASSPAGCEHWLWERNVGVACALYRGFHKRHPIRGKRRDYSMSLDLEYSSKDYLYGRLLAVAERIEEMAMIIAKEPARSTHASRLMQRFSDRPSSTWLTIETGLAPYQQRLRTKRTSLESAYKKLLDDICDLFSKEDFKSDTRLTGEYLLGFHCQRRWLRDHRLEKGEWKVKAIADKNAEEQGDE